jgi:hypothetical protein
MLLRYKEAILYIFFILVFLIVGVLKIYPQVLNVFNIEKNITETSTKVSDLQRKLNELKATAASKTAAQSIQSKKIYKPEGSNLDTETSFSIIFDDIIDMAKYNGVKVYSIEYTYNPSEDVFVKNAAAKYNVCELNMSIIVDYQDLESFLKDIFKYPYLINIGKIEIIPYPKNKKILLTSLQLTLYAEKVAGQQGTDANAQTPAATPAGAATPAPTAPATPAPAAPAPADEDATN